MDAQRLDGNFRFAENEADSGHSFMDGTVFRARAFGEDEDAVAGFQESDDLFDAFGVRISWSMGIAWHRGSPHLKMLLKSVFRAKK